MVAEAPCDGAPIAGGSPDEAEVGRTEAVDPVESSSLETSAASAAARNHDEQHGIA